MDRRRARNAPSRPLVLIIDGHGDTRDLYLEALSGLGFEAIAVDDDAHAYERAWESHPDIIVTELTLPHSDGRHLLQRVKDDPRTRGSPGVVVTGMPRVRRSEEHTSELQSRLHLVCRLLLEKKKKTQNTELLIT